MLRFMLQSPWYVDLELQQAFFTYAVTLIYYSIS
jgi:hypothetical protein